MLESGQEALPHSGGYMLRSVLWVVLDLGEGRELGVVGTHHHRGDDASVGSILAVTVITRSSRSYY